MTITQVQGQPGSPQASGRVRKESEKKRLVALAVTVLPTQGPCKRARALAGKNTLRIRPLAWAAVQPSPPPPKRPPACAAPAAPPPSSRPAHAGCGAGECRGEMMMMKRR